MDIGSSTVANGVLGLVIGVITSLVVEMAFLVQVGNKRTHNIICFFAQVVGVTVIMYKTNMVRFCRQIHRRNCRKGSSVRFGFRI